MWFVFFYTCLCSGLPFFQSFCRAKIIFKGQMKGAADPENSPLKHPSGIVLTKELGSNLILTMLSPLAGKSSCFTQHGTGRNSCRYAHLTSCHGSPDHRGVRAARSAVAIRALRGELGSQAHSFLAASSLPSRWFNPIQRLQRSPSTLVGQPPS